MKTGLIKAQKSSYFIIYQLINILSTPYVEKFPIPVIFAPCHLARISVILRRFKRQHVTLCLRRKKHYKNN